MNLRKRKRLVIGIYKPQFTERLSNQLNDPDTSYDNILLLGDFNVTPEYLKLQDFCDTHDLEDLLIEPTCFKGKNPTCIDLILTNQNPTEPFYEVLDFYYGYIGFPCSYVKGNPKIKFYRDYKHFVNDLFQVDLENGLRSLTDSTYKRFF